jgi:hypothetical protein
MTPQNWLQFTIDWIGLPALAFLAGLLLYRRWFREFPFFFWYIVGAEFVGVARLLSARVLPGMYYRVYWISDTALAAFAFLATYELFFKRLFPGFYKTRLYRLLFPAAMVVTILVTFTALIGGHSSVLTLTSRVYEFLRAAILLFFVGLMLVMGRQWARQEFGIAFGFALDVSMSLVLLGVWSRSANRSPLLDRLAVIAYDLACLIWIYCFWAAPKAQIATASPALSGEALQEARKWENSLKDFMSHGKR